MCTFQNKEAKTNPECLIFYTKTFKTSRYMTEPGIYYPDKLSPAQLDAFLAKGWYRMGQGIFTTNYIIQDGKFFRVFWLRYNLLTWSMSKTSQKIWNANSRFTT